MAGNEEEAMKMPDRDTVVRGLHDIAGFIAGRIGIEQARNFLRTIDDALALLKEQDCTINELQNAYGYLQKQFFEVQDELLKQETELCDRCGWVRLKSSRIAESR
jgi:hypothetical protein